MTTPPPKILLVGGGTAGGGAETRLRLLKQMMFDGAADAAVFNSAQGHEHHGPGELYELGYAGMCSYPVMLSRLRSVLKRKRYDAVLSLGLHQNTLCWAATRGHSSSPALIMTETTRPHTHGSQHLAPARYLIWKIIYRLTYQNADLVAANSIDGVNEVVGHYNVPRSKVRRIPNIVLPDSLAEQPDSLAVDELAWDPPYIVMVGRLEPMKHGDTLIRAAARLHPSLAFTIAFVGDGPDRARLRDLAVSLGIAARVRFSGWQRNPTPFVKRACCTVLASSFKGFSNSVLESMALGTPVVTSFCSSDARAMAEEGAALGFEVGDDVQLAAHLMTLLTEPEIAERLSRNARNYIKPHIGSEAVRAYEDLVQEAISARGDAR